MKQPSSILLASVLTSNCWGMLCDINFAISCLYTVANLVLIFGTLAGKVDVLWGYMTLAAFILPLIPVAIVINLFEPYSRYLFPYSIFLDIIIGVLVSLQLSVAYGHLMELKSATDQQDESKLLESGWLQQNTAVASKQPRKDAPDEIPLVFTLQNSVENPNDDKNIPKA